MTEEIKTNDTVQTKGTKTKQTENTKKVENTNMAKQALFTEEQVNNMISQAVAKALSQQQQTIVQVAKEEYVTILYIGAIATGTVVALPKWGQITYAGGMLDIPKKDFLQGIGIQVNNELLRKRSLIVLNGLTDEERRRFGVEYKEGECLTTEAFFSLLDFNQDKIVEIFTKLCETHKRTVAKIFMSAYFEKHDNRINRETIRELNKISKVVEQEGLFTPIIEDMNNNDK